jgi:hypothetical protein
VDLDVIYSALDWQRDSCGDLCGTVGCEQGIVEGVAWQLHSVEEWWVVMGV